VTHRGNAAAEGEGQGGVSTQGPQEEAERAPKENAHETEPIPQPPVVPVPPEQAAMQCSFCRKCCGSYVRRRTLGKLRAGGYQVARRPDSS
jgi:hypothetical protein